MPRPVDPYDNPQAFPATRWSLVVRAGDGDPLVKRTALGELLHAYWPALRAHLTLRRRLPPDQAEDVLQGFCSDQVLERDLVPRAERERGRLRTFLLTALDRYAINDHHRETADKRRPAGGFAPSEAFDDVAAGAGGDDPARAFDLAWARQVLDRTAARLRAECEASGRADVWGVFEARLLRPALEGAAPEPHGDLAARLALPSAAESANLLTTAKRAYARHLRAVVGEYAPAESIEEEVADLKAILARRG